MLHLLDVITFQKIICEFLTGPALFSDSKYTTLDLPVQIGHRNFGFGGKNKDVNLDTQFEIRAKCRRVESLLKQFENYPFILALHVINSDVIEYLKKKFNHHFGWCSINHHMLVLCIMLFYVGQLKKLYYLQII